MVLKSPSLYGNSAASTPASGSEASNVILSPLIRARVVIRPNESTNCIARSGLWLLAERLLIDRNAKRNKSELLNYLSCKCILKFDNSNNRSDVGDPFELTGQCGSQIVTIS